MSVWNRGDRVQVWSQSQGVWVEGRVEDVVGEGGQLADDGRLPAGSVRVATAKSVMFVPPGRVAEVLRRVSDEAAAVAVIGPGAGMNANQSVYHKLDHDARFRMHVLGQRGETYDRYPDYWDNGSPPPNLESFAYDILGQGVLEQADCILAGSRGGQVVLPCIWRTLGDKAPPAVVINGGCAMTIPGPPVQWPLRAVTILILGGADYFRGRLNGKDYVASTSNRVPQGNSSTAILYIREMDHMPQSSLMQIILQPLLLAAIYWKSSGRPPVYELHNILKDLEIGQWSGSLSYLEAQGKWKEISFGGIEPDQSPTNKAKLRRSATSQMQSLADQELARANELERLVAEKEEELRLLRGQLADSKEKARRLSEAARREEMSSTPTPSPGEERPVVGQSVSSQIIGSIATRRPQRSESPAQVDHHRHQLHHRGLSCRIWPRHHGVRLSLVRQRARRTMAHGASHTPSSSSRGGLLARRLTTIRPRSFHIEAVRDHHEGGRMKFKMHEIAATRGPE